MLSTTILAAEKLRAQFNYDPETGIFTSRKTVNRRMAGKICGAKNARGYVVISFRGHNELAHRLAWLYVHGVWPSKHLDHINRVTSDNRIANLREATNVQNGRNRKVSGNNRSGATGVRFHNGDGVWRAYIGMDGRNIHLGNFKDKDAAIAARDAAERELYAEFSPDHGG